MTNEFLLAYTRTFLRLLLVKRIYVSELLLGKRDITEEITKKATYQRVLVRWLFTCNDPN